MQIIISAGGGGTRLWPLSTNELPKQFTPLFDDESLLLKTYKRLKKSFTDDQIWITTNQKYSEIIRKILPAEFNPDHILTEPEKRDNFAPIITAASIIAGKTSADEPLIFIPSDDWLEDPNHDEIFNEALKKIANSLEKKEFEVVTVGIKPTFPNTQMGHIEINKEDVSKAYNQAVKVLSFREKPNYETAQEYFEREDCFWHKHNPSFTYNSLLKNLKEFWPELVPILEKVHVEGKISTEDFLKLPKIAVDPALLEKTSSIGIVAMNINWNDVGNWEVAYKYLPDMDSNPNQIQLGSHGNKVKLSNSNRKVAFIGVSDLLLVETDEGILIIDPSKSAEVKKAAEYFEGLK